MVPGGSHEETRCGVSEASTGAAGKRPLQTDSSPGQARPEGRLGGSAFPVLCAMAADRGLWRAAWGALGHRCPREEALGPVLGLHRDPGLGDQAMAPCHTGYPETKRAGSL